MPGKGNKQVRMPAEAIGALQIKLGGGDLRRGVDNLPKLGKIIDALHRLGAGDLDRGLAVAEAKVDQVDAVAAMNVQIEALLDSFARYGKPGLDVAAALQQAIKPVVAKIGTGKLDPEDANRVILDLGRLAPDFRIVIEKAVEKAKADEDATA